LHYLVISLPIRRRLHIIFTDFPVEPVTLLTNTPQMPQRTAYFHPARD
jgi:hypothetical protein